MTSPVGNTQADLFEAMRASRPTMDRRHQIAAYYHELGDDALADAHSAGPTGYEADAWSAIVAEVVTRGVAVAPVPSPNTPPSSSPLPDDVMRDQLQAELRAAERVSQWGAASTENNREAKYYGLSAAGQPALRTEMDDWRRFVGAVDLVLIAES